MKTCPQCHHRPSKEELKFFPEYCCKCGTLYSALEVINEKKRKENENLKAWRVTRWRAKNGRGLVFGVPAFLILLYVIYRIGFLVIANSKDISNNVYQKVKAEESGINAEFTKQLYKNDLPHKESGQRISENDKVILSISSETGVKLLLFHEKTSEMLGPVVIQKGKTENISVQKGKYIATIKTEGKTKIVNVVVDHDEQKLNY